MKRSGGIGAFLLIVIVAVIVGFFLVRNAQYSKAPEYEKEESKYEVSLGQTVVFCDISFSVNDFSFEYYNDSTVTCIVNVTMTNNSKTRVNVKDYVFLLRYAKEYEYRQYGSYYDLNREILPLESAVMKLKFRVPNKLEDEKSGRLVFILKKNKVTEQDYWFWPLRGS